MLNLNLIRVYNLDNYIVELYKEDGGLSISDEILDSIQITLNDKQYPKDIVEYLENLKGIKQIAIYDLNKNVLLISDNEFWYYFSLLVYSYLSEPLDQWTYETSRQNNTEQNPGYCF